jgi:hypothetical protein
MVLERGLALAQGPENAHYGMRALAQLGKSRFDQQIRAEQRAIEIDDQRAQCAQFRPDGVAVIVGTRYLGEGETSLKACFGLPVGW